MKYKDEQIALMRNEQKKSKYVNSETGMYVGDSLINFHQMELLSFFKIMMPEEFTQMDPGLAAKKYPSVDRPQLIMTDEEGEVNFTFSLFEQEIEAEKIDGTLNQFQIMITTAQPANKFMGRGHIESDEYRCGWMEFKSHTLDGAVYNILSITVIKERFLLGLFNCPYEEWMEWKPVMLELLNTIHGKEKS
ncbi:hypothetical protein ACOAOT_25210 [Lacrimispora sp. AGF001]|uniref:hypothetical protein n=1 Tax=Lacrimispora sp. AGF001 TaxID=3401631 RepID=UPI003B430DC0